MSTDSSIDRIVFPLLKLLVGKVGDMAHCGNFSLIPQLCNKFRENNLPPRQNNAQFLFFFLFLQFWRCPQLGMALGPDMVELLPVPVCCGDTSAVLVTLEVLPAYTSCKQSALPARHVSFIIAIFHFSFFFLSFFHHFYLLSVSSFDNTLFF